MEDTHGALKILRQLEGTWRTKRQDNSNPLIKDFDYCEEISFKSLGQYTFHYIEQSFSNWNLKKPMNRKIGFLKVDPKTSEVILVSAHDSAITTVEYGEISDIGITLITTTGELCPKQNIQRRFYLDHKCLEYTYDTMTPIPLWNKQFRTEFVKVSEKA